MSREEQQGFAAHLVHAVAENAAAIPGELMRVRQLCNGKWVVEVNRFRAREISGREYHSASGEWLGVASCGCAGSDLMLCWVESRLKLREHVENYFANRGCAKLPDTKEVKAILEEIDRLEEVNA